MRKTHNLDVRFVFDGSSLTDGEVDGVMSALNINDKSLIIDTYSKNFYLNLKEYLEVNGYNNFLIDGVSVSEIDTVNNVKEEVQEEDNIISDDLEEDVNSYKEYESIHDHPITDLVQEKLEKLSLKGGELSKISFKNFDSRGIVAEELGIPIGMLVYDPNIQDECEVEYINNDNKIGGKI